MGVWRMAVLAGAGLMAAAMGVAEAQEFGPANPFYAKSSLQFQAPPFDRIKDADYEPAIEAGIAQQRLEIEAIANNTAVPTFENTVVAMERAGELLTRVTQVFDAITQANTNPVLQKVQERVTPKRSAAQDAIFLNGKLFARVRALYDTRTRLGLDPEGMRLLEVDYRQFVKAGAMLSPAEKDQLKKLNEEESLPESAAAADSLCRCRTRLSSPTSRF